ncbi:MAG: hypothetical protein DRP82_05135, partial [Planctomycetota bacterium]
CSVAHSNKDATQIGRFGVGFKAVYRISHPQDGVAIYSGQFRFRLYRYYQPEYEPCLVMSVQENPDLVEMAEKGAVFVLPVREPRREEIFALLREQMQRFEPCVLLFLRHLKRIIWHDVEKKQTKTVERETEESFVNRIRCVEAILESENTPTEHWIVVEHELSVPEDLLDKMLLDESINEEERDRLSRHPQTLGFAFALRDGVVRPSREQRIFAFLPTQVNSGLRFIIQAHFRTNLSRESILWDEVWNKWLLEKLAERIGPTFAALKSRGMLDVNSYAVFPPDAEGLCEHVRKIYEHAAEYIRHNPVVPVDGKWLPANKTAWPHSRDIRDAVNSTMLATLLKKEVLWLPGNAEERARSFLIRQCGCEEVKRDRILRSLIALDGDSVRLCLRKLNVSSLRRFYALLYDANPDEDEVEQLRALPIVPVVSGGSGKYEFVCPRQNGFFLVKSSKIREWVGALGLPFVPPGLLQSGKDENRITEKATKFLQLLGGQSVSDVPDLFKKCLCPRYKNSGGKRPFRNRENAEHLRLLFSWWQKDKELPVDLAEELSKTPWLRATDGKYYPPSRLYFGSAYGCPDMEEYCKAADLPLISPTYLQHCGNEVVQLFERIGVASLPRLVKRQEVGWGEIYDFLDQKGCKIPYSTRGRTFFYYTLNGAEKVIKGGNLSVVVSQVLFNSLIRHSPTGDKIQSVECWYFYYTDNWEYFSEAPLKDLLRNNAWLLGSDDRFHRPTELYLATSEVRDALGDQVVYLSEVYGEPETLLSECEGLLRVLGINIEPEVDGVLANLESILGGREVNDERIERIYELLRSKCSDDEELIEQLSAEFAERRLVWARKSRRAVTTKECFIEDESFVFGEQRVYLKQEGWSQPILRFFRDLGVREHARPIDYARALAEIAKQRTVPERRVEQLCRRLDSAIRQDGEERCFSDAIDEWDELKKQPIWPAEQEGKFVFAEPDDIILPDHAEYRDIFKKHLKFWPWSAFTALANALGIKALSKQAEKKVWADGLIKDLPLDVFLMGLYADARKVQLIESFTRQRFAAKCEPCSLQQIRVKVVEWFEIELRVGTCREYKQAEPATVEWDTNGDTVLVVAKYKEDDVPIVLSGIAYALEKKFELTGLGELMQMLLHTSVEKCVQHWKRRGVDLGFAETKASQGVPQQETEETEEVEETEEAQEEEGRAKEEVPVAVRK